MAQSFMEFRNTLPSAGAPTNTGMARRQQVESKPAATPLRSSCGGVKRPSR